MEILQIIGIAFGLFAIIKSAFKFKKNKIPLSELIFWTVVWASMIGLALFPAPITLIANYVGIGRGVDLAIYLSIILLFYLVFKIFMKIDKQRTDTTRLVREIALNKK